MKNLDFKILIIALLLFLYSNAVAQEITLKPYGIASAIVDYKYSGTSAGVGTLYFDKYGQRSKLFMDVVERGKRKKGYTLTIGANQYLYSADAREEGIKMPNPIIKELAGKIDVDLESITTKVYGKMGFEKTGTAQFLNKECDVWSGDNGYAWLWKGIVLKMEYQSNGQDMIQEATSIHVNVIIDEALLKVPENVRFTEMPTISF